MLAVRISMLLAVAAIAAAAAAAPSAGAGRCTRRLPRRLPGRTLTVPILMYHLIDVVDAQTPPMTRRLTVAPPVFAAQMSWLVRHGYHSLTQ
jgi:hypothetical protein